jgi:integrase-like protein
LAQARDRRDNARKLIAGGVDPSAQRKVSKREAGEHAANTFETVAREGYAKQARVWVSHHARDVLRRLVTNLFPDLGGRPISAITGTELLAAVRKIEQRGAHEFAHRVLQVASQVFRYGVATGRCERDPAPDLRGALTPHKSRNQAAVKPDDVPELLRAQRVKASKLSFSPDVDAHTLRLPRSSVLRAAFDANAVARAFAQPHN